MKHAPAEAPKASHVSLQSNFVDNLRGFRSQNKLKKALRNTAIVTGTLVSLCFSVEHTKPRTMLILIIFGLLWVLRGYRIVSVIMAIVDLKKTTT